MCHIMLTTWCCLIEEKYLWLQMTIFSVESASEHSVIHFPARKLCAHRVMFINTSSDILASCPLPLFNRHTCFSLCMRSPWTSWTERQKQFCKTCSIMHTHTHTHTRTHAHMHTRTCTCEMLLVPAHSAEQGKHHYQYSYWDCQKHSLYVAACWIH